MTTQEAQQAMKDIFVVDGNLNIFPVRVREKDWERGGVFSAKTDKVPVPIIIQRGGWNKLTTYAGFETRGGAEAFKVAIEASEKTKREKE